MRYGSTTGLAGADVDELAERVQQILDGRGTSLGRHLLGVRRQVELVLMLLCQNISQTLAVDLVGVSQPTVSRIFRRIKPLLTQALAMTGISLEAAITQGHLLLIDGTYTPTGNRPGAGKDTAKANFSTKHHCQCLSVQVAATTGGQLVAVSGPMPGSRHESAALELCGWADALDTQDADWIADTVHTADGAPTPIKKTPGQPRPQWVKQWAAKSPTSAPS
ncbi:DDE superfamily endonuclease [Actinomyces ruminicola]|uniref:DDE superfamily endonuclease n=1 Tax=Actinomyces ruminicola TaxID=332524 RepID=A0A1H0DCY5_9ACTO|nr:transposase [Actinomyces ruminicola]SDN68002.1 DDE superfamily endonuclease [Actinomyces ruminicola]